MSRPHLSRHARAEPSGPVFRLSSAQASWVPRHSATPQVCFRHRCPHRDQCRRPKHRCARPTPTDAHYLRLASRASHTVHLLRVVVCWVAVGMRMVATQTEAKRSPYLQGQRVGFLKQNKPSPLGGASAAAGPSALRASPMHSAGNVAWSPFSKSPAQAAAAALRASPLRAAGNTAWSPFTKSPSRAALFSGGTVADKPRARVPTLTIGAKPP